MNEIQQKIDSLVRQYPKHFSQKIKQDAELCVLIQPDHTGLSISELAYNIVNPNHPAVCERGSQKKFKSYQEGYGFCGRAAHCECAKISVASKVKKSKQSMTAEEKSQVNELRKTTNLTRYGVENSGQTVKAIQRHKEFYQSAEAVSAVLEKVKQTKISRYGNDTYNNPEKIKSTWAQKTDKEKQEIFSRSVSTRATVITPEHYRELWYTKLNEKFREELEVEFMTAVHEYQGVSSHAHYEFKCLKCDFAFITYIDNGHLPVCPVCNPKLKFRSRPELELCDFLDQHNIPYLANSRTVLDSGRELDIYIPSKKIAIEYSGLYWHTMDMPHIYKNYHYDKYVECEKMGIQLITIFSDEWIHNQELVISRLKAKLNLLNHKLHARQCEIVEVSGKTAREFYGRTHIQGTAPASVHLGAELNGQLVAMMSFCKIRYRIKSIPEDAYELLRFSTIPNSIITGIAQRLLKYFEVKHDPTAIVSYSKNEWNTGKLYENLGFKFTGNVKPGYWYVDTAKEKRIHRMSLTKKLLVKQGYDSGLTESEIAAQKGLKKLWDCGNKQWVKFLKPTV